MTENQSHNAAVGELELSGLRDLLGPIERTETNEVSAKSGICEPWIFFSVVSMLGLATSNFLNGMLGTLGLRVLFYYNTGPLVVSSIYFVAKRQGCFDSLPKIPKRGLRETGIYEAKN